jgi:hypothetical protein
MVDSYVAKIMGSDIYTYAEIWRHGKWEAIPEPAAKQYSGYKKSPVEPFDFHCTPYRLFVMLGGAYQENINIIGVTEPITKPRDFPDDINNFYKVYFDKNGTGFARSWLLAKEIIDYPWDEKFVIYRACVNKKYASLFNECCPFPQAFPSEASIFHRQQADTVWVSWRSSCREFVNLDHETCLEDFIDELKKLGEPDKVRIIFWFL